MTFSSGMFYENWQFLENTSQFFPIASFFGWIVSILRFLAIIVEYHFNFPEMVQKKFHIQLPILKTRENIIFQIKKAPLSEAHLIWKFLHVCQLFWKSNCAFHPCFRFSTKVSGSGRILSLRICCESATNNGDPICGLADSSLGLMLRKIRINKTTRWVCGLIILIMLGFWIVAGWE